MKKILLSLATLMLLFTIKAYASSVSVDAFLTPDDVTVTHLETMRSTFQGAINSADGALLQTATVPAAALDANANPENRWNETFNDFVYTGLTIPTSASLSSTTTSGTAYIVGARVVKDATAHTYTASKNTYVDLSNTGTYTYNEVAIGAAEPSVTANSIRLARVSTDATTVTSVRDDRVTNASLVNQDIYVGSFTRDTSLASGTQSVTGVGFTPNAAVFFACADSAGEMSVGFTDGTNSRYTSDDYGITVNTWTFGTTVIYLHTSSGVSYAGTLSSFDSGGFTISWGKDGSPTGTATINYMVFD